MKNSTLAATHDVGELLEKIDRLEAELKKQQEAYTFVGDEQGGHLAIKAANLKVEKWYPECYTEKQVKRVEAERDYVLKKYVTALNTPDAYGPECGQSFKEVTCEEMLEEIRTQHNVEV